MAVAIPVIFKAMACTAHNPALQPTGAWGQGPLRGIKTARTRPMEVSVAPAIMAHNSHATAAGATTTVLAAAFRER